MFSVQSLNGGRLTGGFPNFFAAVAYKRFADTVPLAIDHELVRGVGMSGEVIATLYAHLGMNDAAGHRICRDLAQESPQVADKRADLEKKLERLECAHSELLCLGA